MKIGEILRRNICGEADFINMNGDIMSINKTGRIELILKAKIYKTKKGLLIEPSKIMLVDEGNGPK